MAQLRDRKCRDQRNVQQIVRASNDVDFSASGCQCAVSGQLWSQPIYDWAIFRHATRRDMCAGRPGGEGKCNAKNYGQKCSRNFLNVLHKCKARQSSEWGRDREKGREREREGEGESKVRRAAKNLLIQVIKVIRDHQHAPTRDRTNEQSV